MTEVKFEIKHELPPAKLYKKLQDKFGANFYQGTVFAYGDVIYSMRDLSGDLLAHEIVHLDQQRRVGLKKWWKKYIKDPEFRLEQEVEAYQNQWRWAEEKSPRPYRKQLRKHIIKTLAGKLYGNLITEEEAEELVFF